jgi:acyl carrier protein phosphodiesterase
VGQGVHVAAKLHIQRPIQPQLLANVLHDFVAGAIARQQTRRVAGDHV